jgi:hypothetical protein
MAKKKIELAELGKAHTKDFLKNYQPFLRDEFRVVLESELESEEVLKELFGDNETEFYKLQAVYAYQNL